MSLVQPNLPVQYLDSAISLLCTGVYTITRAAAPTYVNGVETDQTSTTFQVEAVVNPLRGIDLQRLGEGRRSTDFREVWTTPQLNTQSDTGNADFITIGSDTYEVQESEPYQAMGNVWRSIVQRANRLNVAGGGV